MPDVPLDMTPLPKRPECAYGTMQGHVMLFP